MISWFRVNSAEWNGHPKKLKGARNLAGALQKALGQTMWILLVLLILWIASMYFYLPLPVVVLLFAALASAASVTIWAAMNDRRRRSQHVIKQDTNL